MIWTDTSKAETDNLSKGYTCMDNTTINPKTCTWDWKSFFQRSTLELGQKDENTGKLIDFDWSADGRRAVGRTVNGFYVFAKQIPSNYQEASDCPPWDRLSPYYGETYNSKQFYSCSCSQGILGARCRHLANLMLHLEKEHGPFVFTETEDELQARIRAEEEERERKAKEEETAEIVSQIPAGYILSPEEAAQAALRLLEMPEYFNGEVVRLDGCWT